MSNPEPGTPLWHQILLDDLQRDREKRAPRTSIGVNFHLPAHAAVLGAARDIRGMSLGSYVRRAATAFAVFDTGMDWAEIMAEEPRVAERGGAPDQEGPRGLGFGAWKIVDLGEYR